jgi:hypothetical protein
MTGNNTQQSPEQLGEKVTAWMSDKDNQKKAVKYSLIGLGILVAIWILRSLFGGHHDNVG